MTKKANLTETYSATRKIQISILLFLSYQPVQALISKIIENTAAHNGRKRRRNHDPCRSPVEMRKKNNSLHNFCFATKADINECDEIRHISLLLL